MIIFGERNVMTVKRNVSTTLEQNYDFVMYVLSALHQVLTIPSTGCRLQAGTFKVSCYFTTLHLLVFKY